jgi:hypothetical protein
VPPGSRARTGLSRQRSGFEFLRPRAVVQLDNVLPVNRPS